MHRIQELRDVESDRTYLVESTISWICLRSRHEFVVAVLTKLISLHDLALCCFTDAQWDESVISMIWPTPLTMGQWGNESVLQYSRLHDPPIALHGVYYRSSRSAPNESSRHTSLRLFVSFTTYLPKSLSLLHVQYNATKTSQIQEATVCLWLASLLGLPIFTASMWDLCREHTAF